MIRSENCCEGATGVEQEPREQNGSAPRISACLPEHSQFFHRFLEFLSFSDRCRLARDHLVA